MDGVIDIDTLHCKFCSMLANDGTEVPYDILIDAMTVLTHNLKIKSAIAISKNERWLEVARKYEDKCDELSGKIGLLECQLNKEKETSAQYQNTLNTIKNAFMMGVPASTDPGTTSTGQPQNQPSLPPPPPRPPSPKRPVKIPSPNIPMLPYPAPVAAEPLVDQLQLMPPQTASNQGSYRRTSVESGQSSSKLVHMYCEVPKNNSKSPGRRNNQPSTSNETSLSCNSCGVVFMDASTLSHHRKHGHCQIPTTARRDSAGGRPRPSLPSSSADAMNYMQLEAAGSSSSVATVNQENEEEDDVFSNAGSSELSGTISSIGNESIHAAASNMVEEVEVASSSSLKRKRSSVCLGGVPGTEGYQESENHEKLQKAGEFAEMSQNLTFSDDRFQSTRVGQCQPGSEGVATSPPRIRRKTESLSVAVDINCPETSVMLVDSGATPVKLEAGGYENLLGETTPKVRQTHAKASSASRNGDDDVKSSPVKMQPARRSESSKHATNKINNLDKSSFKIESDCSDAGSSTGPSGMMAPQTQEEVSKTIVPTAKRPGRVPNRKKGVVTLNTMWSHQKPHNQRRSSVGNMDNEETPKQKLPPPDEGGTNPVRRLDDGSSQDNKVVQTVVSDSIVVYESPKGPPADSKDDDSESLASVETNPVENTAPPLLNTPCENTQKRSKRPQEKNHRCDKCNKMFTTLKGLEKHVAAHTDTDQFPYHCSLCPRKFSIYGSLQGHLKKQHHGEKTIQCPLCDQKFMKRVGLRMHLTKKHEWQWEDTRDY